MNTILTTTDRLVGKLGPLNHLLNELVARVVPHKVAQAATCACVVVCSSFTTSAGCPDGFQRVVRVCGDVLPPGCGDTVQCPGPCFG